MKTGQSLLVLLCCASLLCLSQVPAFAAAWFSTQLVSGQLEYVDAADTLVINQVAYLATGQNVRPKLQPGDTVTLRYFTRDGKNYYIEYAPGRNSLKEDTADGQPYPGERELK